MTDVYTITFKSNRGDMQLPFFKNFTVIDVDMEDKNFCYFYMIQFLNPSNINILEFIKTLGDFCEFFEFQNLNKEEKSD